MPERPSSSQFQAILFDVDGTLIDSLSGIAKGLGDAIERFCEFRPSQLELQRLIGLPLERQMTMFARSPEDVVPMMELASRRMAVYAEEDSRFEPAIATLALAHRNGLKTALVTSKNSTELEAFLKDFSERGYADVIVCASDVSNPKPHPDSALAACKLLGVHPADCLLIGDSIYDIQCGRSAGTSCAAVAYGAGERHALEAEQPDLLFESPDELLSWAHDAFLATPCPERN